MLHLNLAIAPTSAVGAGNRLGVFGNDLAGFPNGRRLEDDVIDIAERAVAGKLKGNAWALYKNGRCAESVAYSDRALALAPTDTGALYHRSLIERCLGNGVAAARYSARVRSLDPTLPTPSAFRLR